MDSTDPALPAVTIDLTGPEAVERRLSEAAHARREHRRLSRQLDRAVAQVEAADTEVSERRTALIAERHDVVALAGLSFDRLISELEGTLEEQMRKEISEANAAHFAVTEAEDRRAEAVRAMARIQDRLVALGDVDHAWAEALAQKAALLADQGSPASDRLTEISTRRGEIQAERAGAAEALAHGTEVVALLEKARRLLEEADGWTLVDTIMAHGVVTKSPRQVLMDEAAQVLQTADRALDGLHRHVGDLVESASDQADLQALHDACHGWFHPELAEGPMADRARVTLEAVDKARVGVDAVLVALGELDHELSTEDEALVSERDDLIMVGP